MFLEAIISGNAGTNMSNGRPARCAESQYHIGGRVRPRDHRRAESSPVLETTIANRESPAPGVGSILRHAQEPTQLLCGAASLPAASTISRAVADRAARATAIRRSRCFPAPRRGFDRVRNLSTVAQAASKLLNVATVESFERASTPNEASPGLSSGAFHAQTR